MSRNVSPARSRAGSRAGSEVDEANSPMMGELRNMDTLQLLRFMKKNVATGLAETTSRRYQKGREAIQKVHWA